MHGGLLENDLKTETLLHLHATNLSLNCYVLNGDKVQRCKASISSMPWF